MNTQTLPQTALYIHAPFCRRKCLYCSFVVYVAREKMIDDYLGALEQEARLYRGTRLSTVYVGGGTPTLFSEQQLTRLAAIIREHFDISQTKEFSIEANPEDITEEKAVRLHELQFSRISLGAQSFDDRFLKTLGRNHAADKTVSAFSTLRRTGFKNINLDLIFGLPGQTLPDLKRDLEGLLSLRSEHVSIYSLTVEPHSRFYVAQVKEQEAEEQKGFYEFIVHRMESEGLEQYEVSNFARKGKRSLHNLNYWSGGDYIGLGVAAHSHAAGRRSWNISDIKEYLLRMKGGHSPEQGSEVLSPLQRLQETVVFGLRMNAGIDLAQLEAKYETSLPAAQNSRIEEFIRSGLLFRQGQNLSATLQGRLVLDEIAVYLV